VALTDGSHAGFYTLAGVALAGAAIEATLLRAPVPAPAAVRDEARGDEVVLEEAA
jgi:hypothetical protein